MKSIKIILLSVFALILVSFVLTTSTTTISSTYISSALKSSLKSKANSKNSLKIKSKSKSNNESYSFSKLFEAPKMQNLVAKIPNSASQKTTLENWLKISSKSFKNPALHPGILYDGENTVNVKADFADFRLNDAYKRNISVKIEPKEERDFWFRLRKENIFYSSTSADLNVLGEIRFEQIDEIISSEPSEDGFCFTVSDSSNTDWRLCSNEKKIRNTWVCTLEKAAKKPLTDYCLSAVDNPEIEIKEKRVN